MIKENTTKKPTSSVTRRDVKKGIEPVEDDLLDKQYSRPFPVHHLRKSFDRGIGTNWKPFFVGIIDTINIFKRRRLKKEDKEEAEYQINLADWKGRMLMGVDKRKPTFPCVGKKCKGKFGDHYHLPRFGYLKNYEWVHMRVEDFNAFVEEHKEDELVMNKIKNYHLKHRN